MDESKPFPSVLNENAPEKPRYLLKETLFAWLLLVFGYFFWLIFPLWEKPAASALLLSSVYALTFLVLLRGRIRFDRVTFLVLFSAVLALLAALLWDNRFHAFICFAYLIAAYAYLVFAATGNSLEGTWSDLLASDLLRAWFVFPFSSFVRLFGALVPSKGTNIWRMLLKVSLGLFLAVIPTWIALSLLSFDSGFTALITHLFRFRTERPEEILIRLLFAVPVAMYVFGLYLSSVTGTPEKESVAARVRLRTERRRILPLLSAAAAVIPLLIVYIIFFISQWDYYVSAFTGLLPASLSYAEYAREGFFQLCGVAFLNFLVLTALARYVRRGKEKPRRLLCVVIVVFTLILIATAFSKLSLYVREYGLTPDRLHAAWFMLLLTILFILVLLKQFFEDFKALPFALAVTVALFLLLSLSGSNRMIARYNTERFLSGESAVIDVQALSGLGDDAVPYLLRLRNAADGEAAFAPNDSQCRQIEYCLLRRSGQERSFWESTFSSARAERLLVAAGYASEDP